MKKELFENMWISERFQLRTQNPKSIMAASWLQRLNSQSCSYASYVFCIYEFLCLLSLLDPQIWNLCETYFSVGNIAIIALDRTYAFDPDL